MAVIINFKICDNAKECGGIAACPTGALSWDEKKKAIKIDNSKCKSCGKCAKECPIEAIKVARTEKEYAKLKKEIDEDPRKASDLFIDRYGAQPVHPAFLIHENEFNIDSLSPKKIMVAELFSDGSIMCLLRSITIKDLIGDYETNYLKIKIGEGTLTKKYKISQLPALVFFEDGKLLGKIEGYYDKDKKEELSKLIEKIINKK